MHDDDDDGSPTRTPPLGASAGRQGSRTVDSRAWLPDGTGAAPAPTALIDEQPVALVFNGISHAVMLATPADLDDFARGFALSEGIVQHAAEVRDIEVDIHANGIEVQLTIGAGAFARLKGRRRALAGRTGCGLCGVESLADAVRPPPPLPGNGARTLPGSRFTRQALDTALAQLCAGQVLHRATGAAHAAAWADVDGNVQLLREDVGRHNALDKLIGALAVQPPPPAGAGAGGFIVVTSRASYEMVHKTATAGVGLLAAVSAPTAMAVRVAQGAGVTLVGLAARTSPLVYTHGWRLAPAFAGPTTAANGAASAAEGAHR